MSFGIIMPETTIEPSKSTDQKSADVPSGDLISRQWLLDLYEIDTTDFKETAKVPLEVVIQNIKDAPSVSIQPNTIVNNCDHFATIACTSGRERSYTHEEAKGMTDLISREDAIEIIASHDETNGTEKVFTGREITDLLAMLPSADRPTENFCRDCPIYSADRLQVNSAEWVAEKEKEFEELHRPDYSYEADMVRRLKDTLSADRPKGEWVEVFDFVHLAWECSKCGAITSIKTPFCCECGADMKGGA